ncbi:MAG: cation diffusion facilitator family transporter [Methylotenera sp.]|nr:cation diffusion facilitator family transporter [Methylotenera sp.]MDO9233714.1 cation diffusion facilitator family transporter [Methylotenera sp.]MDO9389482.1 cation diffusion facilitator family transporter [Methylotenera sp.]MDP2102926.1 cation diffusion facilitator family transporter [Methylotenera sp.]MDP2281345.1 cation diffusion facilitator family transporter [Methylotenera sp.]
MTTQHHYPDHAHDEHYNHNHYLIPFLLIFVFAIVEALGGWWTGSLALISDAGHMFSDVVALGLAWMASIVAKKPNVARHKSGVSYAELAVSIINAITMLAVIAFVIVEAIARFKQPHQVQGLALTVIATLGLIVNLIVAKQLRHQALHHGKSLNNRAAFLHVIGDLLGSLAAVAAGIVIYFTGWMPIDPILSLLISVLLLVFTLNLIHDIIKTLQGKAGLSRHDHAH